MKIGKDVIEKYGKAQPGKATYREAIVRKAERVRNLTHLGVTAVVGVLGWILYLAVPGVAIGIGIGAAICAGTSITCVAIVRVSRAYANSTKIIKYVRGAGVREDE